MRATAASLRALAAVGVLAGALAAAGAGAQAATLGSPAPGGSSASAAGGGSRVRPYKPPRVRHVFVIVLENEGYTATFGDPAADPYLAQTLPAEGALLENYYATGHESNDNYISLVSGQPPNAQNQADCPRFDNFVGALMLEDGVESGTGCVYPAEVQNIGTQLTAAKRCGRRTCRTWATTPTARPPPAGILRSKAPTKRRKRSPATATQAATTRSCTSTR